MSVPVWGRMTACFQPGESAPAPGSRDLYALTDAATLASRSRLFSDVWLAAPAYRSLIERLPFDPTGGTP